MVVLILGLRPVLWYRFIPSLVKIDCPLSWIEPGVQSLNKSRPVKNLHFDWFFRQICDITEDHALCKPKQNYVANPNKYSAEIYLALKYITRLLQCYLIGMTVNFIPNGCEMSYL